MQVLSHDLPYTITVFNDIESMPVHIWHLLSRHIIYNVGIGYRNGRRSRHSIGVASHEIKRDEACRLFDVGDRLAQSRRKVSIEVVKFASR